MYKDIKVVCKKAVYNNTASQNIELQYIINKYNNYKYEKNLNIINK